MYSVFNSDAAPAVGFKTSAGAIITNHEDIRVSYAITGGCSIDHTFKAAALGVVDDAIVLVGIYQACVLSFAAYFGASSGTVSATSLNPASQTRTVVAGSVVFGTALAAGPLVAGTAYAFTCEALLLMQARNRRRHACSTHACVNHAPHDPI